ncbi:hypothetical protein [Mycoplasmopsis bovirhinis]|uniref:hypothetical protein n=1 Tax=Mycoplasmopsis bovirhinis TaxID=29553 RepID=UPI003A7F48E0
MEQKHGTTIPALSMDIVNNLNILSHLYHSKSKIVAILDNFSSSASWNKPSAKTIWILPK